MADYTEFCNLRREVGADMYNVLITLDDNWNKIDAIFDPDGVPAPGEPKAMLRGQALTQTFTGNTSGALLDLEPVWNSTGTLQVILIDVDHQVAGAASRALDVRRDHNPIFTVDITTQDAVNGVTVEGGATGTPAIIRGIGTDPNVGIDFEPKGSGPVTINHVVVLKAGDSIPASTITGNLPASQISGTLPTSTLARPHQALSASHVILAAEMLTVFEIDATGGVRTITLPDASTVTGLWVDVKKVDASANSVTTNTTGGQTIDTAATKTNTVQNDDYTFYSTGAEWIII